MKPGIILPSLFVLLPVFLSAQAGGVLRPASRSSEVFAQGAISTPEYGELNSAFTKDGKEIYFSRRGIPGKKPQIMVSSITGNGWELPVPVSFTGIWSDIDPFIPPGGGSMLFCSTRPHGAGEEEKADHDLWISDRTVDGWSEPRLFAPEAVSASEDFFPVLTAGGNLYFNSQRGGPGTNDIYRSEFRDGHYTPAVKLPEPVNTPFREFDAFVTQDEKMIVFSSERPGGYGGADLYATWKDQDGKWSEPVNLGSRINSAGSEYGSAFSPDGNTFFFTSNRKGSEDIFSIPAGVFEVLQKNIPGAPRAICTITYLGNEGFLCETGTRKIIVDAIFGGISGNWCEQPGDSLTDLMIHGKEPFGEIDLVLVTHCHADHFNAPMTIAFLQNHGESVLVCPAQAAEKLKRADGYSAISGRIVPVNSFAHPDTTFTMKGVSIRAMRFRHGSWMESDPATGKQRDVHEGVENLGYLFETDGCSVLHTGDGSSTDKAGFALHNLSEREVDVVFLDRTFLSRQGYGIVCENILSRNFIFMHVEPGKKQFYQPTPGGSSGMFIFQTLMQKKTITRNSGRASTERIKILQQGLDSMTRNLGIPGATFAARFRDGSAVSLASGLADSEAGKSMQPGTMMFSGSVGKTFVAAVVLKLAADGMINLDAKASEYLDGESWFGKVPNAGMFTVKMLLNHTAGVPEYVYHDELWKQIRTDPGKTWSIAERMAFITNDPPSNPPGGGWNYADSHYILLGAIIEKVTGKPYYEILRELILVPFGLQHTLPADRRELPGLAAGYTELTGEMYLPHKVLNNGLYAFNPQLEWTGGGLVTNVDELAGWASMLYGGDVLPAAEKRLMLTPAPFTTPLPFNARYGLGCIIGEKEAWYGHTGFVPGYITILQYIPEHDLALAMQVNTDNLHGTKAKEVFESLKNIILDTMP